MMSFSYLIWLLGIALAVIVGLSVFHVYAAAVVLNNPHSDGKSEAGPLSALFC